jgi:ATP-dependent Clp protease ATP-binding subunit ClpA
VVEDTIKRPLTDEILFGKLAGGGKLKIEAEGGEIDLAFEPAAVRSAPAPVARD